MQKNFSLPLLHFFSVNLLISLVRWNFIRESPQRTNLFEESGRNKWSGFKCGVKSKGSDDRLLSEGNLESLRAGFGKFARILALACD